jgi:hypothetical protein
MRKIFIFMLLASSCAVIVYFAALRGGPESAEAERITLDEGRGAILALSGGNLTALSHNRFVLYDKAGRERVSRAVAFELPALAAAGSKVVIYDRAGETAIVAEPSGIRAEFDFPVLTAAGNGRGQYILVTSESGYRSTAGLYDTRDRLTYKWYSAERYILAASLSPSGRRMAVAAVGQQGETVSTLVTFLEPGRIEPLGSAEITGELPLAAYSPDNNHVCILTESGVYFYSDDGQLLGRYPFGGMRLLSYHFAGEALFINLGRNEGGQHSSLICLGYTGAELGSYQFTEGPDSADAAGRWCAVLEAGSLTRFTLEGTELKAEFLGPSAAHGLLVDSRGNILLLYSGYARWYNEEERGGPQGGELISPAGTVTLDIDTTELE